MSILLHWYKAREKIFNISRGKPVQFSQQKITSFYFFFSLRAIEWFKKVILQILDVVLALILPWLTFLLKNSVLPWSFDTLSRVRCSFTWGWLYFVCSRNFSIKLVISLFPNFHRMYGCKFKHFGASKSVKQPIFINKYVWK